MNEVSRVVAFGLIALGLLSGSAHAEQTFSFDTTPGKLPKIAVPSHYAIELAPDLQALTADGSEVIDIEVRETDLAVAAQCRQPHDSRRQASTTARSAPRSRSIHAPRPRR